MTSNKIGILLTNVGSPDQPTAFSVRRFLKKFLSDPRVVEIPRFIWTPILYGFILPFRSRSSAKLYQKIWTENGSPLTYYSNQLANKLKIETGLPVAIGMHYGNPSVDTALEQLRALNVSKILILPLFPQYSATTTAVTFDQVTSVLKNWRDIPEIRTIHDYAEDEYYINAICNSIQKHSIQHLLFSFHGIPEYCITKGDPYFDQCNNTVKLITEKLNLTSNDYSIGFQSRLGKAKWLSPYTDKVLQELIKRGILNLHVICPGFAVDCLETLEEINMRYKKLFLNAGGKSFQYIPALNSSSEHVEMLQKIITKHLF